MELRDYLNVIGARKWIIIVTVVTVTAVALVASFLQHPSYSSEASVRIAVQGAGADVFGSVLTNLSGQPDRALATEVQVMQLRPFAETTIRRLNLQMTPEQLLKKVQVADVGNTDLITISATDGDPQRAADIANAMADAYVEWSRQSRRQAINQAAAEVQSRLDQSKAELLALANRLVDKVNRNDAQVNAANRNKKSTAPAIVSSDVQYSGLSSELQIASGMYSTLASKLEELRVNAQLETGSGIVVSAAAVNPVPVGPKPVRNGVLGLAVGLVFGLSLAFLAEYLDNTVKSDDEAEKEYGAPVLGHVPTERLATDQRRLTIVERPGSSAAEAYRVLRNSLDFVNFEHNMKTLLITSAAPDEGKSTVAANLAAGLAQAGSKVVLVNCDFRRPVTEQFFEVNNAVGLSDVLTDTSPLEAALQKPGDENLLVLTSGKLPPNPCELLGSTKMSNLLESLKRSADWIIVDSPPLLAVADTSTVARWVDGILMVTRAGTSTRETAKKGREMLAKVGARVVGVVVWGLEQGGHGRGYGYYGYGYYSAYSYHERYTSEQPDKKRSKQEKSRDPDAT